MNKNKIYFIASIFIIIGLAIAAIVPAIKKHDMSMDEKRVEFVSLKMSIQEELRPQQMYRCCLETPCTYCIEKTPGHGDGAACDCLKDIVEGVHPCGECIGEILEGHGNPLLAEYFARAVAEKVGEEHTDTLKEIIFEKYGLPVGDQL